MLSATCSRCVMDTSDPHITFDADGVCNHCRKFEADRKTIQEEPSGSLAERIRHRGRGRKYDCLAAISGGADSSYMLHCAHQMGLRILALHVDYGWNTATAVANIEALVRGMQTDLHTYVVDWDEFRSVQLAYLAAGVPDLEVPTDHAFNTALYKVAAEKNIPVILTGHNRATESLMPAAWICDKKDACNLLHIYREFGNGTPLRSFPVFTMLRKFRYYNLRRIEQVHLLNHLRYRKQEAMELLQREYGWTPYGVKHGESTWTRFYQCAILPQRFGIDKRRAHYSNLICSGQMTREEALEKLKQPPYEPQQYIADKAYILKKFDISEAAFDRFLQQPVRHHSDFRSDRAFKKLYNRLRRLLPVLRTSDRY